MALQVSTGTPGAASPGANQFPADHKYYEKKFLEALQPEQMYDKFGSRCAIDSNSSNTIVVKKMAELASLEDSPLSEGVTPTEQSLSMTRIEKSVDQYGGYIRTTDRLSTEGLNGVTIEFSKRLGQQASRTMNRVNRDGLLGGTNVRRQNAASPDIDAITAQVTPANLVTDFDYMRDAFRLAYVKPLKGMTNGSTNIGTLPTASAYVVIVPVEAVDFIEQMDDGNGNTFKQVETYSGQTDLYPNEFGRYKNFRFLFDPETNTETNSAATPQTIAQCLVFGQGVEDKPYKVVDLAGGNLQMITKELGSSGSLDPLNQRASMGWKAKQATFIVQDLYMFRYEISLGNA
jgi:N4-gp56 family major capsid protein